MRKLLLFLCLLGLILCRAHHKKSHKNVKPGSIQVNPDFLRAPKGSIHFDMDFSHKGSLHVYNDQEAGGAFDESDSDKYEHSSDDDGKQHPVRPVAPVQCPTLFYGCDYTGKYIEMCKNIPDFDVNAIHSIWLPAGSQVTFYGSKNYSGAKVIFKRSDPCFNHLFD